MKEIGPEKCEATVFVIAGLIEIPDSGSKLESLTSEYQASPTQAVMQTMQRVCWRDRRCIVPVDSY